MSEMTSISREILRCNHSQITSDPFSKDDLLTETGAGITFGVHMEFGYDRKGSLFYHRAGALWRIRRGGSGSEV